MNDKEGEKEKEAKERSEERARCLLRSFLPDGALRQLYEKHMAH